MNCFVIAVGLTIACAPSTVEEPAPSPPDTDVSEDTASGSGLVVTGQGWAIGTTPSALDQTWFGPTVEGSTEAHEFVLTNTGASEIVEIEGAVSGSGFSLVEPLPPRLEGHETGLFQLVYAAEPGSPSAEAEVQITWAGGELVFSVAGVARSAWNKESDQSERWGHVQFARSEVLSAGELVEADLRDLAEVLTAAVPGNETR